MVTWTDVYACVKLSLSWFHCITMCPHLCDHLTSNTLPWLQMRSISFDRHWCTFCFHCRLLLQCSEVWRDIWGSEHKAHNTLTILLTAAFMLIIGQAVCLCPLLDANTQSTSALQWSVSYHKHFFNSTFNLPGLKSPQTTIWHQPQLLHCDGTEQRNMI